MSHFRLPSRILSIQCTFGKHLAQQGAACALRDGFYCVSLQHRYQSLGLPLPGDLRETTVALTPLVPQQRGDHVTSPLAFCPCPPLGQKAKEMDPPDFSPSWDGPRQNLPMYDAALLWQASTLVQCHDFLLQTILKKKKKRKKKCTF